VLLALTREVSPNLGRCELTHLRRQTIDAALAAAQHRRYEECLAGLGCRILRLPAAPELADSVFVEDTCVVSDELAVIARPGADSRTPETRSVAEALRPHRPLRYIEPPATLDGGDVLCLGKKIFVGLSSRTNPAGIDQLRSLLASHGFSVTAVEVSGCLHLKSAVTQAGEKTLLVNPSLVDPGAFRGWELIEVDPSEPLAANALLVKDTVIYPAGFPKTQRRLEGRGLRVRAVDISELAKAEGAVTCCSVFFRV
jgi:dimethylargininase